MSFDFELLKKIYYTIAKQRPLGPLSLLPGEPSIRMDISFYMDEFSSLEGDYVKGFDSICFFDPDVGGGTHAFSWGCDYKSVKCFRINDFLYNYLKDLAN